MGVCESHAGCRRDNVLIIKINMTLQWFYENAVDIGDSIGIDEVGRGPLAGPVVSVAFWISAAIAEKLEANRSVLPVRDSKKLSHRQRQRVVNWINEQSPDFVKYAVGCASVDEIDSINILHAALLSMKRAYSNLRMEDKSFILVDGNTAPDFLNNSITVKTIIKGDAKVLNISLASIIAKEYRDSLMKDLAKDFPLYGWQTNVGYGTKEHLEAIRKFGITQHHRKSFAPVRKCAIK